jgi:serine/threonine protein kinase
MTQFEYLGPYKLGEMLGRGGMGAVYAAEHAKTGEKVAVKVIAQAVADEMRFRRRFSGEIETLKRLRHKSIVRIIGTGEQEDLLFYSMELVEGETLQQRLRREKRLSWQTTIDIAIQVCSALKHAHDIGAFHRDLKPANLMLTADGTVKLVDFGIVKLFGYGEETVAGSILGTADYMAPEQADGRPTTARTDLYSLGSVMYAMLAGRPPFIGRRLTEVIESLKRDRPVPLEMVNPDVPEALVELIHEMLEKNPEDRPPTALAVMKRLQAMRAGLLREQTLNQQGSPTVDAEAKKRPHEKLDLSSEINNRNTAETGPIALPRTALSSDRHTDAEPPRTVATSGRVQSNESRPDRAAPDDVTLVSIQSSSADDTQVPDQPSAKTRNTHFQTVDSHRPIETVFGSKHDDTSASWIQYLSTAGMVAILAGGIGLFAWSVRTPSADVLYSRILQADHDGDITSAQALIKLFVTHYPDDSRQEAIIELSSAVELEQYVRQLRTKANRAGGTDQLDPAEQAFLDAFSSRGRGAGQTILQLQQWLDVFGYEEGGGYSIRKMKSYAEDEIERLRLVQEQTVQMDSRVEDLRSRMLWARTNLDLEKRRAMLQGIIELYRRKAWASTAVQFAEKELAELSK